RAVHRGAGGRSLGALPLLRPRGARQGGPRRDARGAVRRENEDAEGDLLPGEALHGAIWLHPEGHVQPGPGCEGRTAVRDVEHEPGQPALGLLRPDRDPHSGFGEEAMRTSSACVLLALAALAGAAPDSPFRFRDVARETGLLPALAGIRGHAAAWGDIDG